MDVNTNKILYDCIFNLVEKLFFECNMNRMKNNLFEKIIERNTNIKKSEKIDYKVINSYIIAILLNNRAFFKERFSKLPWDLSLNELNPETTINNFPASNYSEQSKIINNNDDYEYSENFLNEYKQYIDKKYKDSPYEPDTQELIVFEQKYNDDHGIDYKPKNYKVFNRKEKYNIALATLPSRLKNKTGPNINMIIQCIRNALAHNQFYFTEEGLSIFSKNIETGEINFECNISNIDMIDILKQYITIITNENMIKETPYIMNILFNDIYDIQVNNNYEGLKEILGKEFKILNLENEFLEILNNSENEIERKRSYYLRDYDKVNDDNSEDIYLDYTNCILLMNYAKSFINNNYHKINSQYKLIEILFILNEFNELMGEYGNDKDYLQGLYNERMIDVDSPVEIIEKNTSFLNKFKVSILSSGILAKLSVLLNILFVQCSYENVDRDLIKIKEMKINNDYIMEKNNIFAPQLDKIRKKYDDTVIKINKLEEAINTGKVSIEKQKILSEMKNELIRMANNVKKMKNDWDNSLHFNNLSIINHIRNSFAHGSYTIQVPNRGMDLKSLNIIIKDYEPETDKLTFSGTISVYNLLNSILKPKIIQQLFFEKSRNK